MTSHRLSRSTYIPRKNNELEAKTSQTSHLDDARTVHNQCRQSILMQTRFLDSKEANRRALFPFSIVGFLVTTQRRIWCVSQSHPAPRQVQSRNSVCKYLSIFRSPLVTEALSDIMAVFVFYQTMFEQKRAGLHFQSGPLSYSSETAAVFPVPHNGDGSLFNPDSG